MRDNPLGMAWARRLLRSVHQGVLGKLDLMGCTFQDTSTSSSAAAVGSSAALFNPNEPDGTYHLDLGNAAAHQAS
ncbi:uncharacterized protein HaLaN_31818, partial [Haematococcus lacustris]